MRELKDFATIIEELIILILRENEYIFSTKRQNSTKIKQDNALASVAKKHLLFCEKFSVFLGFFQERQTGLVYYIPTLA